MVQERGAYEELAQWPPHDARHVLVEVLGALGGGLCLPAAEDGAGVAAVVDFFNVVVHVLDEEDVVVEDLLVFLGRAHGAARAEAGCVFGDLLESDPHALIDALVGLVDGLANLARGVTHSAGAAGAAGKDVLERCAKMGECAHEADDSLAFLQKDLCLFDSVDLGIDELVEDDAQLCVRVCQRAEQEVLAGLV